MKLGELWADKAMIEEEQKRGEEISALLREAEEHKRWLETADMEELKEARMRLIEEYEKNPHGKTAKTTEERKSYDSIEELLDSLYTPEVVFEKSLNELDEAMERRETR